MPEPTTQQEREAQIIRNAGGIIHRDGNIFFTNFAQFLQAARSLPPTDARVQKALEDVVKQLSDLFESRSAQGFAREAAAFRRSAEIVRAAARQDCASHDRLSAEVERLRGFAKAVMGNWPDVGCDGFDLQVYGEKFGLLERLERIAPCCEDGCRCADDAGAGPVECYRLTALVKGAALSAQQNGGKS